MNSAMSSAKSSNKSSNKSASTEVTYHALFKWSKAMYEKLGWMYLTQQKHNLSGHKVAAYKESVDHLLECIKVKIDKIQDMDKKADLMILHDNTMILKKAIHKLL